MGNSHSSGQASSRIP